MITIEPDIPATEARIVVEATELMPDRIWIRGVRRSITPNEARKLAAALITQADEIEYPRTTELLKEVGR